MAALEGTGLQESDILDFSVSVNPLGAPAGVGRAIEAFFLQAEDGIRGADVTRVQTCALPIYIDSQTGCIIELSAVLHDIGSVEALRKYGSMEGHLQEQEGVPIARNILNEHNYEPFVIERSEERRVGKECRSRGSQ